MISFEEASRLCFAEKVTAEEEIVSLISSNGRILAEDIFSDTDMPPFDKSAVDGYACRKADLNPEPVASQDLVSRPLLECIETIPAGKVPEKKIGPGQCSKIMTGAMIPEGADTVIMVEDTEALPDGHIRFAGQKTAANICFTAEDIRQEEKVLDKGTLIRPQEVAVLASVGITAVNVFKKPSVGLLITGDELVEPGQELPRGRIRNSNGWQLLAQLKNLGIHSEYLGIVSDKESILAEKLEASIGRNDVTLVTGGVSMGDFDYVPVVLSSLGCEIVFRSIAVQPGRPTVFAKKDGRFIFGLPGNPVSSFVLLEVLVKPFLLKCTGAKEISGFMQLPLGKEYTRKRSSRLSLVPVEIKDGKVFTVEYHGSAHIQAYTSANGIMKVPIGIIKIEEGEPVDVRPL